MPLPTDEMVGSTLKHYRIVEKVGEGGMGVVYRALDTHLDRTVAIKVLRPEAVEDAERKWRFVREAKAASALNHPHIVTIHDIDADQGVDFMVMEYVEGTSLDRLIPKGGLPVPEALDYAEQIASALGAAHAAGIVHRDVKPANVIVGRGGRVKVLDFGLAKLIESGGSRRGSDLRLDRDGRVRLPAHPAGRDPGHDRLHVARAGAGESRGRALRRLLPGLGALRDARRPPAIRRGLASPDADGDSPRSASAPEIRALGRARAARAHRSAFPREASGGPLPDGQRDGEGARGLPGRPPAPPPRPGAGPGCGRPSCSPPSSFLLAAGGVAAWKIARDSRVRGARAALPEISRLVEQQKAGAAIRLAGQAERYVPAEVARLRRESWPSVSVRTEPAGAEVSIKDYLDVNGDWQPLGVSPIEGVRLPLAYYRWKIAKQGFQTVEAAAPNQRDPIRLDPISAVPAGMVRVPAEASRFAA